MKLRQKITLILSMVITLIIILLTGVIYWTWYNAMQKQVALDAMDQAIIIAENDIIQNNIQLENGYINITKALESIQQKTKIQYLYVINQEGLYYTHPLPSRVNTPALPEELKHSPLTTTPQFFYDMTKDATVEGYAPIFTDGFHSGVVVVGIYNGRILQTLRVHIMIIMVFALIAIGIGVWIAFMLAKNIKKEIFNLEPEEIAILLNQRELILENMGEGIIATDRIGNILMINENAKHLLSAPALVVNSNLNGHKIDTYIITMRARKLDDYETELRLASGIILKLKIKALDTVDERLGFLYKLEDMSLVRKRAEELTNMVQLTQALRAQNHEFMNKLHTISGLIQLEEYEKVLEFIEQTSQSQQAIIGSLNRQVQVPALSGLLLAKYSKASEYKIKLTIHPQTLVTRLPIRAIEDDMTSILGNLIDNAIEALAETDAPQIEVKMFEQNQILHIEVSDNGPGIKEELLSLYLDTGFSTKGKNRGFGLPIVVNIVHILEGKITFINQNGLRCIVSIPVEPIKAVETDTLTQTKED